MSIPAFADIWSHLERATRERSPFNFLSLASLGLDGSPQLRTIVLRAADGKAGTLHFVTDFRSPKIAEIGRDPRVALTGYDPVRNGQIRMSGVARLVEDEIVRKALWDRLRGGTRTLFEAPYPPGTPLTEDGAGPADPAFRPEEGDLYYRFAPVEITLSHLEWLDLAATPHLRCRYGRTAAGWASSRLSP